MSSSGSTTSPEDVVRPAAHEWDEREETPWPIIEEAAKIGLYSFDFVANCYADPTGLLLPLVNEELAWGDAGIALSILGSTLRRGRHRRWRVRPSRLPSGCLSASASRATLRLAAFCVSEADAGSDVEQPEDPRRLRPGERHLDASTGRRRGSRTAGSPTSTWSSLRSSRSSERAARRVSSCRRTRQDCRWARSSRRWASGRPTPPRSCCEDVKVPGSCLLGGKDRFDERLARCTRGKVRKILGCYGHLRGHPPGCGGPGGRDRSSRLRVRRSTTPRSGRPSDGRSSSTRRSPSSSPT